MALELLESNTSIDVALLDFAMPGMNEVEVAKQMQSKNPGLPNLFITGYADKTALGGVDDARLIRKPFVGDELARKVYAALQIGFHSSGTVIPIRR